MGRIAQQSVTSTAYFLGDALGSVRQLTDGGGRLALARWYDPYGNLASNRGDAATVYGFTGEWGTTLLDLRARWYAPAYGRFNSKDVWPSDYQQPLSLNKWLYSLSNPVNYTDPSGHCADTDTECWAKATEIVVAFPNVRINMGYGPEWLDWLTRCEGPYFSRHWKTSELEGVQQGLETTLRAFDNNISSFEAAFGTLTFSRQTSNLADPFVQGVTIGWQPFHLPGYIVVYDNSANYGVVVDTVVHEMGHVLDLREYRKSWFTAPWSYGLLVGEHSVIHAGAWMAKTRRREPASSGR